MAETSTDGSSTVTRRQLSRLLRELRNETGRTMEEAAEELGISVSSLSRIELGKTSASPPVVRTMCQVYGRPDMVEGLLILAKASKTKSWYHQYSDVIPDWFSSYIGLEQAAAQFRSYEAELVPGIIQTAEYARTVIRNDHPTDSDEEVDRRVQLRMKRQALLTRETNRQQWHILIGEAILWRPVGGSTAMKEQLQRLLEVSELPNVVLGVVPFGVGMHPGVTAGPFVLLDFPNPLDPTTVYVEGYTGALCTDDPAEVEKYRAAFEGIEKAALNPADTRALIARKAKEIES
ncbi:helix-turn-helix domain-containing protein [Nocardia neocaledoniensis]|uniref:helix-turn-helix domain-containing protein n=1 Tax=Nocardia neocaledoniensis TaxID=236511 RepID=UPI00245693C1|nr:helix-turn-helix transcriptional regulator [Nocardia neocaledoniensis]